MENLSCQDILRHCSPFRQGVCQSSTALWECWNTAMMPPVLQPEAPWAPLSVLAFSPSVWDDLLTVKGQRPSVFVPVLSPAMWAPSTPLCSQLCDPSPLPSPFLHPCGQRPGPHCLGLLLSWPPPHCVLPEASARTRCRLMASSRNPATFSLSSYTQQTKECIGKKKIRTRYGISVLLHVDLICLKMQKSQWGHLSIVVDEGLQQRSFYIYLSYEGVVNKLTGKVFGGVSWKFHIICKNNFRTTTISHR